jgi:prolyl-tRNA synthetase
MENNTLELARRDTLTKEIVVQDDISGRIKNLLDEIQTNLFDRALEFRNGLITEVNTFDEFVEVLNNKGGFISAHWDGTAETEEQIKNKTKATIRCIPSGTKDEEGKCIWSGKKSFKRVLFAKAY